MVEQAAEHQRLTAYAFSILRLGFQLGRKSPLTDDRGTFFADLKPIGCDRTSNLTVNTVISERILVNGASGCRPLWD